MPLNHLTVFHLCHFVVKFLFQTNPLLFSLSTLGRLPDWSGKLSMKFQKIIYINNAILI